MSPGEGLLIGPFVFSPSAAMNWAYDSNIFSVEKGFCAVHSKSEDPDGDGTLSKSVCTEFVRPQAGSVATARGIFALKLPFSHSYSSLTWTPQYRRYGDYNVPRKTSHVLTFETILNFANGSVLQVTDDYNRGYQDARNLDTSGELQLSTTAFSRNNTELRYDWSISGAWGFTGQASRLEVVYDRTQVLDFSALAGGSGGDRSGIFEFFDYQMNSLEWGMYRDFSRMRIYASGVLGRTVQDTSKFNESQAELCPTCKPIPSDRIREEGLEVGIGGPIFPSTNADLSVGWDRWRFKEDITPPFAGVSLAAKVDHKFNRRMVGYVELARMPIQATGSVTGYYVRSDATVGVERRINMQMRASASLTMRRYSYSGSLSELTTATSGDDPTFQPFTFTDLSANLELRYRLAQASRQSPLMLGVAYSPIQRVSSVGGLEYSGQRVTVSCTYGWF